MILVSGGSQAVGVGTEGALPFRIPVVQYQSAPKVMGLLVSHEEDKKHKIAGKKEEGLLFESCQDNERERRVRRGCTEGIDSIPFAT
jgi:hypothetical protein